MSNGYNYSCNHDNMIIVERLRAKKALESQQHRRYKTRSSITQPNKRR